MKHIFDTNVIEFAFQDCFHNNEFYSNSLDNAIITTMHIALTNYLIFMKCYPMRSHLFGGSRIHDPLTYALRLSFILYYKYVVVIIFCVFLLVLAFVFLPIKNFPIELNNDS